MTKANDTNNVLETIRAVRPAAAYLGGKRNLAKRVCAIIDDTDHDAYAEPFVGMGGIFLRRSSRPKVEQINDISGDVANLFRVLQEHYPYFIDMLRWRLASRNEFKRLSAMSADQLTDLQRAARFLYLQKLAFGGKVTGQNFGVNNQSPARFRVSQIEPMLADIHERLQGVVIEQLPFAQFIKRYDRLGVLFYSDPPYFGYENYYGEDVFMREDFERLAQLARSARGKMIISINDRPEVRAIFSDLHQRELTTTYSVGARSAGAKTAGEIIISNFEIGNLL
jgi:DNA adenine methylase